MQILTDFCPLLHHLHWHKWQLYQLTNLLSKRLDNLIFASMSLQLCDKICQYFRFGWNAVLLSKDVAYVIVFQGGLAVLKNCPVFRKSIYNRRSSFWCCFSFYVGDNGSSLVSLLKKIKFLSRSFSLCGRLLSGEVCFNCSFNDFEFVFVSI